MNNTPDRDPWELEQDDEEEKETKEKAEEYRSSPDYINARHINPEIPEESYDDFIWDAIKEALSVSETEEEVFRKMAYWNKKNRPQIPGKPLTKKTLWELKNFDSKFKTS